MIVGAFIGRRYSEDGSARMVVHNPLLIYALIFVCFIVLVVSVCRLV